MSNCKGKYPNRESAALTAKMEKETPPIPEDGTGTAVAECPNQAGSPGKPAKQSNKDDKQKKENKKEECGFTGIQIDRDQRKFTYQWSVDSSDGWSGNQGIALDSRKNRENVFEVVASERTPAVVIVKKTGLKGPGNSCKHKEQPWDAEGCPDHNVEQCDLILSPKKTTYRQKSHFLAWYSKPAVQEIKGVSCDGSRSVQVKCYPDTKTELKIGGTLWSGGYSFDDERKLSGDLEYGSLTLSLASYRDGKLEEQFSLGDSGTFKKREKEESSSLKDKFEKAKKELQWAQTLFQSLSKSSDLDKWHAKDERGDKTKRRRGKRGIPRGSHTGKLTLFKGDVEITGQWEELEGSRHCAYRVKEKIVIDPLIGYEVEFDISTHVLASFPPLLAAVKALDGFLQAFEAGECGIRFKAEGALGVTSPEKVTTLKGPELKAEAPDNTVDFKSDLILTLRAVARIDVGFKPKIDRWEIAVGAAATAELGMRAGFKSSDEVYKTLEALNRGEPLSRVMKGETAPKPSEKEEGVFSKAKKWASEKSNSIRAWWRKNMYESELKKHPNEADRKAKLIRKDGTITLKVPVGFTGLEIYTIWYCEIGAKVEKTALQDPGMPKDGKYRANRESKMGLDKKRSWGKKEPKIHCVAFAYVNVGNPEFTIWK